MVWRDGKEVPYLLLSTRMVGENAIYFADIFGIFTQLFSAEINRLSVTVEQINAEQHFVNVKSTPA